MPTPVNRPQLLREVAATLDQAILFQGDHASSRILVRFSGAEAAVLVAVLRSAADAIDPDMVHASR